MEKAKKERLIGAIILVLLLVSIVPMILNGNFKEAPKRNDSLEMLDQIKKERIIYNLSITNKKNSQFKNIDELISLLKRKQFRVI